MDHHRGVLPCFHDLIQVADGSLTYCPGQRPVHPYGLTTLEQEPPDQVGRSHVFMTGDRDEFSTEFVRHSLDEAGLPAACRPLQQHRQAASGSSLEDLHLITNWAVEGCGCIGGV